MNRQVCPFHADDDLVGVPRDAEGGYTFTCARNAGHPAAGPYTWHAAPEPLDLPELSGLAEDLGLAIELPRVIATFTGQWVEYGVVEAGYAAANREDFGSLVARYGHTSIKSTQYSVSAFLAATLGRLADRGSVLYMDGPATGRWHYNGRISWWSVEPRPQTTSMLSWEAAGLTTGYVRGSVEVRP